jgi:hypothetical protein
MRGLPIHAAFLAIVMASMVSYAADRPEADAARDGSSFQRAVIVSVAEPDRFKWEMTQLLQHHPDMELRGFARGTVSHMGRLYDICELQSQAGKKVTMYFDVGPDEVPSPNQAMQALNQGKSVELF